MRLYYFTSLIHGLSSIRDNQLKISRFDELNDPFDILSISAEGSDELKALKKERDRLCKKGGMICMSESWNETLMWAHYAKSYTGICLAFEVDIAEWMQVTYEGKRRKLSDYKVDKLYDLTDDQLAEISTLKSPSWSYEKEWRRFFTFGKPDWVSGLNFAKFDSGMKLVGALIGPKAKVTSDQIKRILEDNTEIKLGFIRPGNTTYKVILHSTRIAEEIPSGRRFVRPLPIGGLKLSSR